MQTVQLREYAYQIVTSSDLETKLAHPVGLNDSAPGDPLRLEAPGRCERLTVRRSRDVKVPPIDGMRDPTQRRRIFHALANHELQAVELFAWALLAFPGAPSAFRRGLLAILVDEQRHCRLYADHIRSLGAKFGDYPVTGHFWHKLASITTPLQFVCTMGLTFENANLDFASDYERAARTAGDQPGATILAQVHRDEIRHVRFAWRWLLKLKPADSSPWQTYIENLAWPLGPARARGRTFDSRARQQAGLSAYFISRLEQTLPKRPSGEPR